MCSLLSYKDIFIIVFNYPIFAIFLDIIVELVTVKK